MKQVEYHVEGWQCLDRLHASRPFSGMHAAETVMPAYSVFFLLLYSETNELLTRTAFCCFHEQKKCPN